MKQKKRGKKAGSIAIAVVLLALTLLIGYYMLQVRHVKVVGAEIFTESDITKLANIPANTEMLRVDEKQIKTNIESNPYLELKSLDYELPDTVVLTISERSPAALLAVGNSYLLMDRQFVVLKAKDSADAGKYPVIAGISMKKADIGKQINTPDAAKIPAATAILDELKKQDVTDLITQISLKDINNILFKTKNGPDVLFGQPGNEAAKIAWVKKLLPDLISQGKSTGVLDVTPGTFATYGGNHMPASTPAPSTSASASPGASASPTEGAKSSASPGASASASKDPEASPSHGVSGAAPLG